MCNQFEEDDQEPKETFETIGHRSAARFLSQSIDRVGNRGKTSEIMQFCRMITLQRLFRLIGVSIGTYPLAYFIAALIMGCLSCGIYWLKLEDRVRDGYTPLTSPSRYETDVLREFLQSVGAPTLVTVVLRSTNRSSMHHLKYLEEAVRLHRFLMKNLTASLPNSDERITYEAMCGFYCKTNIAIEYFYRALVDEIARTSMGKQKSHLMNLSYPIAKIMGFDVHLERSFYGVQLQPTNGNLDEDTDPDMRIYTNIKYMHVILMIFCGDIPTVEMEAKLKAWELAVYNFSINGYFNPNVEMLVLGTEIVNQELMKNSQRIVLFFIAGFISMFIFVASSVMLRKAFSSALSLTELVVAFGVSMCPVLAILVTFGVCGLAGFRTNSIMLIMPFLIMGVGVNDAFLLVHSMQRLSSVHSISERLGLVFEECGPSITISTLTNVISFSMGAYSATPEIALFCMAAAMALGFVYIFTLVLFGPMLYLANGKHTNLRSPSKVAVLAKTALKVYCQIIRHRSFCYALLPATLVYWYFGIMGTLNIRTHLDVEKLLPKNSPVQISNTVVTNLVWSEYYPVTIIVNNPLDLRNNSIMNAFYTMLDRFESMDKCKGKEFTLLWLREYLTFWNQSILYDFDYFANDENESTSLHNSSMDYSKLSDFLQSPYHKHWNASIRLGNNSELPIEKFSMTVAYQNALTWNDRIDLMLEWREIAQSFPVLNVTVWEANSMFVDQMLSLKALTFLTSLWTFICMIVVCALFIQNPISVVTASLAILSISFGVVGYLSWWHLDLDPAVFCAVLMSIGMSVDFTAHVSYHYQLNSEKQITNGRIIKVKLRGCQERLEHTLSTVAWPMIQAGLSTVVCILPLVFLQDYFSLVFVKTISLLVIWGLFHGLVLLPAFLSAIPDSLIQFNCYGIMFGHRSMLPSHGVNNDRLASQPEDNLLKVDPNGTT